MIASRFRIVRSIADWLALNSIELTWIALVSMGVIAVGMLM